MKHIRFSILSALLLLTLVGGAPIVFAAGAEHASHRSLEDEKNRDKNEFAPPTMMPVNLMSQGALTASNLGTNSTLTHTTMGFHPYWMGDAWQSYDWSALSHLAYFKIVAEFDGDLVTSNPNYDPPAALIQTAHANGVKVVLAVTSTDTNAMNTLVDSPTWHSKAADNIVAKVVAAGADGVNIDFEMLSAANRDKFSAFAQQVASKMHIAIPTAHVSVDLPAIDWNNAYDAAALGQSADALVLMGYDYFGSWSSTAGPVAPLYDPDWRSNYSVNSSLTNYLNVVDPGKMILGVPWYGGSWTTSGTGVPSGVKNWQGSVLYHEAEDEATQYGKNWYAPSQNPYVAANNGSNFQTWYDDYTSLNAKYQLATDKSLGGVAVWALGYDGGRAELWDGLRTYGTGVPDPLQRLYGYTRYDTAVAISQDAFPVDDSAGAVVLSVGTNWPDALGGSVLAKKNNAPLLLVQKNAIPGQTWNELNRVLSPGGTVFILGGTSAASTDVENTVRNAGYNTVRLAGSGRRATAREVAKALGAQPTMIIVATEQNFPDSLSVGGPAAQNGAPILLTERTRLSREVTDYLDGPNGAAVTDVVVVGGEAVVSSRVVTALQNRGESVVRLAGGDRFATSEAIARFFYNDPTALPASVSLTTGLNYPDGLSGAAHAATQPAPVLLVRPTDIPGPIQAFLQSFATSIVDGHIYGGINVVNTSVKNTAQSLFAP